MTPHEIGLKLIELLMTGKVPAKHSDALWDAAIKIFNMPCKINIGTSPFTNPLPVIMPPNNDYSITD